ncbi:hypothetical protein FB566_0336 [Stackebrandtia endophytica]|uniref:YdbS-like PH domain-containing protein n=1 Tax=Stackebrandtia endophytica TaxID=1496996 RepID=A0A543AQI1_9ACTN|nr:PH domain-containing protein [Stackebrandtia endophytica]TQL74847.1 hypothetical protein FB566_0336 [Stackebrandtia endophytica]
MSDEHPVWDSWPGDVSWQPVSPRLAIVRILSLLLVGIPTGGLATLLSWLWWGSPWWQITASVLTAILLLRIVLTGRVVRAWGYAERADDLLIRHGLWTKRLSIVPYGRMQFIDLSANPLQRMFDLSTVKLHTASAGTDSTVPGLAPTEAAALRDRLAERANREREGL